MDDMTETMAYEGARAVYVAARASGMGTADACCAVMDAMPAVDADSVADLSWRVETGAPAPAWQDEDGAPTQALLDWQRGHEARAVAS